MTHKPCEIAKLSAAQILKVKKGLPVIIKPGKAMKVMLDELQHRQATAAFKKGKGLTVILSSAMQGSGVFSDVGKVLGELGGEALGTFLTRGRGKKGCGVPEDVVRAFTKGKGFKDDVFRPVASHLIHNGIPLAGGVLFICSCWNACGLNSWRTCRS